MKEYLDPGMDRVLGSETGSFRLVGEERISGRIRRPMGCIRLAAGNEYSLDAKLLTSVTHYYVMKEDLSEVAGTNEAGEIIKEA